MEMEMLITHTELIVFTILHFMTHFTGTVGIMILIATTRAGQCRLAGVGDIPVTDGVTDGVTQVMVGDIQATILHIGAAVIILRTIPVTLFILAGEEITLMDKEGRLEPMLTATKGVHLPMLHKMLRAEIKVPVPALPVQLAQVIQEEEQLQVQDYGKHRKEIVFQPNRVLPTTMC
jgi:hypothetical protein